MRPIVIGHVLHSFKEGGMERGVLNLINHGNDKNFYHVIICLTEAGRLVKELITENCKVVELHKKKGNDLRLPGTLAKTIRQCNIDLLHARGWPTMVETVIANSLQRVRALVYGFHGRTIEDLRSGKSLKRMLAERLCIRLYDRILTLTDSMRQELSRDCWLSEEKIEIIHNGVDVQRFAPFPEKLILRKKFGLPPEKFVIGAVGRLDPIKNHEIILRALRLLKNNGNDCVFLLIGEGDNRRHLEREIERLEVEREVILFGRSSHVPELISCMDVFVQSSWYEGFSNTVLEAMSCGVPVVVSKVGGSPSVVPSFGRSNVFDPTDECRLAEILESLIHDVDLCNRLGKLGRERVQKEYSIQRMVENYERVYSQLID